MLNSKGLFALKSALLAGAAVVATSGIAVAQDKKDEQKVEKVTVTGTRIKQRDFTSISPLATVGSKDLALSGTVNTEQLINTLPQIVPGVTITSNNPSLNGFATADLRGLGPGRTLILVNGRRANPSSSGGLVDLNTIPSSLIDRIEIISGGASAVYGADAVAGAINFIMKDNYEGIELSSSYSQAEDGIAPAWSANGILGGKFDGDRGSIMLGVQYYNRQPALATARYFSRYAAPQFRIAATGTRFPSFDPSARQTNWIVRGNGGSATAPWGSIAGFSSANVTTVLGHAQPDADCFAGNGTTTTGTIRFAPGGGIWSFQNCPYPNVVSDPLGTVEADGDRYNFAPDNDLILGNERINTSVYGKYDVLPDGLLQAFVDATYTNSQSAQQLAATPATNLVVKWDIDPNPGSVVVNPYILAQPKLLSLGQLQFGGVIGSNTGLDNQTFLLNIRTNQVGLRQGFIETNAFGTTEGFRGTMPTLDWDWEIYHSFARNSTIVKNNNNISQSAMEQLLNACETTSSALQLQPATALPNCIFPNNAAPVTSPSHGAFTPTATSNNPLGFLSLSPDMINFIRRNTTDVITYEREMFSGTATGDVVDLWGAGPIGAAVGFEYREESLDTRIDPIKSSGDVIGFNAANSVAGGYDVYELFGEVNIPLITDQVLFHKLELTGGYRKSDYSNAAGITNTYKYGAEWSPFEWLTFRGVKNHAVRAPSAFELFRAGDQNFPAYTDPCDKLSVTPAITPACNLWFSSSGAGAFAPGVFAQNNGQVQAFLFGNQNLKPEIADTLTYGVVFNPDWWPVGKLGVSVDRYEIEFDNQITSFSVSQILNGCITGGGNIATDPFCVLAPRNPLTGQVASVNQTLQNFSGVQLYAGIDVNLRWSWDLEKDLGVPGTFGIASLYSWTDANGDTAGGSGAQGFYVGSVGGIIPVDKAATTFSYDLEDWSFALRWDYIGKVQDGIFLTIANGGTSDEFVQSYNLYNFGARYKMTDDMEFSFGMDNIFDKQPPVWAGASAAGQFNTDGSTYEQLGRQFRLGLKWKH